MRMKIRLLLIVFSQIITRSINLVYTALKHKAMRIKLNDEQMNE